ncbi:heterokaryon incompatibility protein-domain-containing protein [Leptodontidium sp. MPI-SDFR-AT-0119]|nr:heterokaryon incompatibility protein-domain-containing protein [Leptodontidium sp. MPI-SDFR-AT-0119]
MLVSDGLNFCKLCEQFRDLDRITSWEPLLHHKSWTELCISAKDGCQLCQAFVRGQAQRFGALKDDFDRDKEFPATRLTWRPNGASGPYFLCQEGLFFYPHREVVNLGFDLYTHHDNPLASIISERPINEYSNSEACFEMIAKWMLDCKKYHAGCSWSQDHILPTRVIDVGDCVSSTPFLVTTNGATGAWLTLSHCWGGKLPLSTTLETLEQRMEGIPMGHLPATFRDAIEITRTLGFRYIWIDTFCIIQDCHQDWERESTKMQEIYANASFCIAASAAPNSEAGIFASADRERQLSRPLISFSSTSLSKKLQGTISLRWQLDGFPYTSIVNENLHQRAWAFQEGILAQRTLDFASTQIRWHCRSTSLSQRNPTSALSPTYEAIGPMGRFLFQFPVEKLRAHPNIRGYGIGSCTDHIMDWWYTAFWYYVRRSITVHNDLLPAIAGVAQNVAERSGYHYYAGLWQEDFHRGLLWQAIETVKRELSTSSPSWSWASTQFPWGCGLRRLDLGTYESGHKAKVLELTTTTSTGNPYAQVFTSCLIIEGFCRPLSHWQDDVAPVYNGERWQEDLQISHRWLREDDGKWPLNIPPQGRIVCTLDERPEKPDTCHVEMSFLQAILLQIARFGHHSRKLNLSEYKTLGSTAFALILQPSGERSEEYRRIGIAEVPTDDGMADGWDIKVVTIV